MFTLESRCTSQSKGLAKRVPVPISSNEYASHALGAQGVAHRLHRYHHCDDGDGGDDGDAQKKLRLGLTFFL